MAIPPAPTVSNALTATWWDGNVRSPIAALPAARRQHAGQLFVGTGNGQMQPLVRPSANRGWLAYVAGDTHAFATANIRWRSWRSLARQIPAGSITRTMPQGLNLPALTTADADKYLRINAAGNGYEVTETPPWQ